MKQINDICFDRIYYYGRIIPAFEHYLADWFSFRIGAEGAFALLNDTPLGYGFLAGLTFRIASWGLDIDLNFSYRLRPSRVVEEIMYPEMIMTLGISLKLLDEEPACAWQLIYDRAKALHALGRFEKITAPQDWSTGIDGRPRTVIRQDQRIAEEQAPR